jgi:hypothetical protein
VTPGIPIDIELCIEVRHKLAGQQLLKPRNTLIGRADG